MPGELAPAVLLPVGSSGGPPGAPGGVRQPLRVLATASRSATFKTRSPREIVMDDALFIRGMLVQDTARPPAPCEPLLVVRDQYQAVSGGRRRSPWQRSESSWTGELRPKAVAAARGFRPAETPVRGASRPAA